MLVFFFSGTQLQSRNVKNKMARVLTKLHYSMCPSMRFLLAR